MTIMPTGTRLPRPFRGGRRIKFAAFFAVLALAAVTRVPQALAFPYHRSFGETQVYSSSPIGPRLAVELARADALLAHSPLAAKPGKRTLVLTNGGWRWRLLSITYSGAFAFRRPLSRALIFNRSDIDRDAVYDDQPVAGQRTLSGTIAHETTHLVLARRYGEIAMRLQPRWKEEGFADYVARESSLSDAEAARLRAAGSHNPALFYHDARQRVAALLVARSGAVDALFRR